MKLKPVVVVLSLMAGVSAASAATQDLGPATLTYDETTTFEYLASWFSSGDTYGFSWSFSSAASVENIGSGTTIKPVVLPSFTLTPNAGYTLSGGFNASLGKLVYNEVGDGATTGILASGDVSVNGETPTSYSGGISWIETFGSLAASSGYFAGSATLPIGSFTSIAVSNAHLDLSASGGTYSNIIATSDNKIEFSFTAVPIPEPETYAMLLAGLGVMGAIARRRKSVQK